MSKKYTEEQLSAAKSLYLKYEPISAIEKTTGIGRSAIMYHIPKWREIRDLAKSEVIDALSDGKKMLISSISKNGLEILAKSLAHLAASDRNLSVKEMRGVSDIIDSLDKIIKLDEGSPTEILAEVKPSTTFEIRKLLKSDPFLIEEAEVLGENLEILDSTADGGSSRPNSDAESPGVA